MTQKSNSKTLAPARKVPTSRRDGLLILLALVGLVIIGVAFSQLINLLELDNKVDVTNYPGSEKASLTDKGTSFIENKYTSDKPTSDYYKVRLTTDSCETVLQYYRTEASKKGWNIEKPGGSSAGARVLADSYRKSEKGLFVYCAPGTEQLAQNAGGKNTIIVLTADGVLDLNPSTVLAPV